jgi:hypothetical protein
MKRGTKRGNSTLDTLTGDSNTRSVNKRIKRKTKDTSHQSTTVQVDDSFISVDNDGNEQNIAYYKTLVTKLENQVQSLSVDMKELQKQITGLITQMSFVTSWLENSVTPEQCSAAFMDFAAAVKRPAVSIDRSVQESAVAAVYVDNQRRLNRSTNFIVSGLSPSTLRPDQNAVVDLCRQVFNESLDIVHCRRLGKPITGRVQPLLVILKTVDQAQRIITAAKTLRQSTDPLISQHVFIAANLTKAEARAAYEVRCQRRQAAERRDRKLHQPELPQSVSASYATVSHQSQQPSHKLQHQQKNYHTSNSATITAGSQPIQHHQLPPLPQPQVKPANPVIAVEVHQPPTQLPQLQHAFHQTNQPHQLQWLQHQPYMSHCSVDDQPLPSTIQHQQSQYSQPLSAPMHHSQFMQPLQPQHHSQLPMTSTQYYPGS